MSNTMRWRYGETNPVMVPTQAGTVIEIGDLLYLDSGNAKPASSQSDQGSLTANQETFHDNFVGVAMQSTPGTIAGAIRVATSGVFEYDCASATFQIGDLIGSNEEGTGTQLESQEVVGVATENLAVGRCASQVSPAANKVLVEVTSTTMRGGPQVAA